MAEMTIVVTLLFMLLLGFVDFGHAFYQWNAASKAVQVGARLAAVSNPVANSTVLTQAATNNTALVGVVMEPDSYEFSCEAGSCTPSGTGFNQAAFNLIFSGDPETNPPGGPRRRGMVDFFPGLQPDQVRIEYVATGLGFWTRPGGAVPTIRVSIVNRNFEFFFLSGLLSFTPIQMPPMTSTITGEDLSTTY